MLVQPRTGVVVRIQGQHQNCSWATVASMVGQRLGPDWYDRSGRLLRVLGFRTGGGGGSHEHRVVDKSKVG